MVEKFNAKSQNPLRFAEKPLCESLGALRLCVYNPKNWMVISEVFTTEHTEDTESSMVGKN
jgi:hypothetical protein